MEPIYLDNNATTRPAAEVLELMWPCFTERYGNASSLHELGVAAADAIAAARANVARLIGARDPARVVFTSGGTESDQTALRSAWARRGKRRKIVTTAVEHSAVLEPLAQLEREGALGERVGVRPSGRLDESELLDRVDDDTALVAVMWANNETGAIHPVERIAAGCRARGVPLHVDAVQACGKLSMRVDELGADYVALSGHKLHGPKGVGALWVRPGVELVPFVRGGPQERERRGGTENVPAIVGLGRAAQLARAWLASDGPGRLAALRDRLERGLLERIAGASVHAGEVPRVPNTTNLRFEGLSGEALVLLLSGEGICASTGAACASSRHKPSHVLLAMGLGPAEAGSSVRFSLSRYTTEDEILRTLEVVPSAVSRLRALAGARG
jgi:cysteine desulfurase